MPKLGSLSMPAPHAVLSKDRLVALDDYDILDTPPEAGFDDIVQLATLVCNVPIALVGFVAGDRQWFKARIGFPPCQTDLNSSICAHALAAPDLLVIPDLTADPRTRDNPLVTGEPSMRFYAGAPLRTREGQGLGSLCVIDNVPRPGGLTPLQAEMLHNLARQVMTLMEMRQVITGRDTFIARRRQAEEEQQLLNGELSHRMKNMLAMIQAIASQTLKGVTERDAVDSFQQRLLALSSAHDVLLRKSWTAAPMREVVEGVLRRLAPPERFVASGPDIMLGAHATLSASLLLHELATNAAKHGALASDAGQVIATWHADRAKGELVLTWKEAGGPPVAEPTRKGFGSRLIRSGLIGTGGVSLRYLPTGFEAEMRADLEQVQAS